jgi:hypothetical protein
MRRLLSTFGLLALMGGTAFATDPKEYTAPGNEPTAGTTKIRLDRSVFDQVGPHVDINALCGPGGAAHFENRRDGSDVLLTFLSFGFYTPTHVHVKCNTTTGQPMGMR